MDPASPASTTTAAQRSAWDVLLAFAKLGLTSFGGPIAHIGYFRQEFVGRRQWMTEASFADLVALCQFLPGPTSSQVGFAIGLREAGLAGGLAAFVGFTTPSALLMFAAASGLFALTGGAGMAIVHGLMLVAVSVVAHAVYGMARSLCTSAFTALLAVVATAAILLSGASWMQPVVILAGGAIGALAGARPPGASHLIASQSERRRGLIACVIFIALLIGLPLLAAQTGGPAERLAESFYRSGALVFGGGHVVLPLLEAETVGRHWVTQSTFLSGYAAAQALPGPLFAFAAFLGASSIPDIPPIIGAVIALSAIFLPGLLLVSGALAFWVDLKRWRWAAGFVRGANAAVVGVLAAALYRPVMTSAILGPLDAMIAIAGFIALQVFRAPSWLVVIAVAAAGAIAHAV